MVAKLKCTKACIHTYILIQIHAECISIICTHTHIHTTYIYIYIYVVLPCIVYELLCYCMQFYASTYIYIHIYVYVSYMYAVCIIYKYSDRWMPAKHINVLSWDGFMIIWCKFATKAAHFKYSYPQQHSYVYMCVFMCVCDIYIVIAYFTYFTIIYEPQLFHTQIELQGVWVLSCCKEALNWLLHSELRLRKSGFA